MKTIIGCKKWLLLYSTFSLILFVSFGCGNSSNEAQSFIVAVSLQDTENIPDDATHLHYILLDAEGNREYLQPEYSIAGRNTIEVPINTKTIIAQFHDANHEILQEVIEILAYEGSTSPGDNSQAVQLKNYNYWMTHDFDVQGASLAEITIPGAHDAGMGKIASCSSYAGADVTKTQQMSFGGMLNSGIRYFDIRPVIDKYGRMYLGHFTWVGTDINIGIHKFTLRNEGCYGFTVEGMLEDVRKFLAKSDNHEVIILKMSHFLDFEKYDVKGSTFDKADLHRLKLQVIEALDGYLLKGNDDFRNTRISALTKDGAKVIVTFDADDYDGSEGIYSQKYLKLYDESSDTNNLDKMIDDQFKKMDEYGREIGRPVNPYVTSVDANGKCYGQCKEWLAFEEAIDKKRLAKDYFILSWTLTQSEHQIIGCMIGDIGRPFGYVCKPLQQLDAAANKNIVSKIAKQCNRKKVFPNVVYTDNAGAETTRASMNLPHL